jgi:O-acetylserine/cysteine efflux transporter
VAALGYVVLCLIWGSTWLGIKTGLDAGMPPLLGAALRFAVASVILVPLALFTARASFRDRVAWRLAILLGVCSFGIGYGCTYIGGRLVPSGLGSLTFGVFPFWVAVLAHFRLGDRLTLGKLLAIGIGIVGLVLLYSGSLAELGRDSVYGVAIITGSVIIQGFAQIAIKRDGHHVPALFLSGIGELIGSIVLVCVAVLRGEWSQPFPLTTARCSGPSRIWRCSGSIVTFLIYYNY